MVTRRESDCHPGESPTPPLCDESANTFFVDYAPVSSTGHGGICPRCLCIRSSGNCTRHPAEFLSRSWGGSTTPVPQPCIRGSHTHGRQSPQASRPLDFLPGEVTQIHAVFFPANITCCSRRVPRQLYSASHGLRTTTVTVASGP